MSEVQQETRVACGAQDQWPLEGAWIVSQCMWNYAIGQRWHVLQRTLRGGRGPEGNRYGRKLGEPVNLDDVVTKT